MKVKKTMHTFVSTYTSEWERWTKNEKMLSFQLKNQTAEHSEGSSRGDRLWLLSDSQSVSEATVDRVSMCVGNKI